MTIADLYEQPFKSLHIDGIDGLFQDEEAHLIAGFVAGFTVKADEPVQKVALPVSGQAPEQAAEQPKH